MRFIMKLPTLQTLLRLVTMIALDSMSSVVLIPPAGVCRCTFDTEMRFIMKLPTLRTLLKLLTMFTLDSTSSVVLIPPAGV